MAGGGRWTSGSERHLIPREFSARGRSSTRWRSFTRRALIRRLRKGRCHHARTGPCRGHCIRTVLGRCSGYKRIPWHVGFIRYRERSIRVRDPADDKRWCTTQLEFGRKTMWEPRGREGGRPCSTQTVRKITVGCGGEPSQPAREGTERKRAGPSR